MRDGGPHTAHEIATACGIPRRTSYRDLDVLVYENWISRTADTGLWKLTAYGKSLTVPTLSAEDALALALTEAYLDASATPIRRIAHEALAKITSSFSPYLRHHFRSVHHAATLKARVRQDTDDPWVVPLLSAISDVSDGADDLRERP